MKGRVEKKRLEKGGKIRTKTLRPNTACIHTIFVLNSTSGAVPWQEKTKFITASNLSAWLGKIYPHEVTGIRDD